MERKNEQDAPVVKAAKERRADAWLRTLHPSLTGRQGEEALEAGLVRAAGGHHVRKGARIARAEDLDSTGLLEHLARVGAGNRALQVAIVHEGADFCVVDKPAGMPSHPISLFDFETVSHWALARFAGLVAEFPEAQPTVTPHRLDTGTSGCQIVALTADAFARWRERFHLHQVEKTYLAWCWGTPAEETFTMTTPLAHAPGDRRRMAADDAGREAITEVAVERTGEGLFLARVRCRTGVTHQVRAHLALAGYPLAGDKLYDADFAMRAWQPAHHQLRAVSLGVDDERYRVPEEIFIAAPSTPPS